MSWRYSRRDYTHAQTSIWWNMENCEVPEDLDAHKTVSNIRSALENLNFSGSTSMFAYADVSQIPKNHIQTCISSSSSCHLTHVPLTPEGNNATDQKILEEIMFWAMDNGTPANIMIISGGNTIFSNVVCKLKSRGYNIMLAQPNKTHEIAITSSPSPIVNVADRVWIWGNLARGGYPLTPDTYISHQISCDAHGAVCDETAIDAVSSPHQTF